MYRENPATRRAAKRRWYLKNKEKHKASLERSPATLKRYRDAIPHEVKLARWRLWEAIRWGHIIRPDSCEWCGCLCTPHGHHTDYAKPLEVLWLCPSCHGKTRQKDWEVPK